MTLIAPPRLPTAPRTRDAALDAWLAKVATAINDTLLRVVDDNRTLRVELGRFSDDEFGIRIYDASGTLIFGVDGLEDDTVGTGAIADGAVTEAKLATDSVSTLKIQDGAVTTLKLDDEAVTTGKIALLAVTAAQIANDTITDAQIAADAVGTSELAPGAVTNTEVNAAAAIARSKLATDTATLSLSVPISALRDATGLPLGTAELAGGFNVSLSANVLVAQAEIADNETEVSTVYAQVSLPPEYKAGGAITVRLPCTIVKTGAAVDNGSTIDLNVYKQTNGAVGSDLCATAAQTFAAVDTWYNKAFTVTPTGLVAGDVLNLVITSSVVDSEAGAGTLRLNLDVPQLLLDIQG